MNAATCTFERITTAIAAMGDGPLAREGIEAHVRPLFSRVLRDAGPRIYLANHSLGRPPDAMQADVSEALAAWYEGMGEAWIRWNAEIVDYRARIAALLGVADATAVIPKANAGQGLRAVLNTWDRPLRVVATRGEFDSLDVILREYAQRGRLELRLVAPGQDGRFAADALCDAITPGVDLVVLSPVMFQTGQVVPDVAGLVRHAHAAGSQVLLDVYHALGVVPLDLTALDADFAVGGSYKYLRGGPGACFLYVHPRHLARGLRTLDTGWFAKQAPFDYARPEPPRYAPGGDGWLESTPAVLPVYQARAGLIFTLAVGVERLRAHSLRLQRQLIGLLSEYGIDARGGSADHGAFVVVRNAAARAWVVALREHHVIADARGDWLRLCPDVLTNEDELVAAAAALGRVKWGQVN